MQEVETSEDVGGLAGEGNTSPRPARILVVDDHSIVREGLRYLLADELDGAVVGAAGDGGEALAMLGKQSWDLVLLDLSLPGRNGLEVLEELVAAQPNMAVLVFSVHEEKQFAVRALRLGAAGYVTKSASPAALVFAVKKVLAGGKYVSPALAENLVANLSPRFGKLNHEALSDREYQVMRFIATGKSVKQIAEELSLSVKTVSTYRVRLLEKMHLTTNADIVRYALANKLVD